MTTYALVTLSKFMSFAIKRLITAGDESVSVFLDAYARVCVCVCVCVTVSYTHLTLPTIPRV